MRYLLIAVLIFSMSGCLSVEEIRKQQNVRIDWAKNMCLRMGYQEGTNELAECTKEAYLGFPSTRPTEVKVQQEPTQTECQSAMGVVTCSTK